MSHDLVFEVDQIMQPLARAAPVRDVTHEECVCPRLVHDLMHAERMCPTAKHKQVSDEFEGIGNPMRNFKAAEQLLEEKCNSCGFSTPMPQMGIQCLDDCISTAAPSPALTDISSAWATPTPGCSASSFLDIGTASWGDDFAALFEHELKLDGMSTHSGQALKMCPAPAFGESDVMSCIERVCKEAFPEPSSSKDISAGFISPFNPGNLSLPVPAVLSSPLLDQTTPPGTPRKSIVPASMATPQIQNYSKVTPPPAPTAAAMPPLLRALHEGSIDTVRSVLERDTHAATSLFWEHDVEPPLCSAVRLGCSPEVVGFLLDHQADVDGLDSRGRTPLAILAFLASCGAQSSWQGSNFCDSRTATSEADAEEKRHRAIEKLLIQAGADQNHSSIASARRPHQAIRQFNGTAQTISLLPWTMDSDLEAILREPQRHL